MPEETEDLQKKADEYLNNWKRAAADFINYKKGEIERAGLLINYAKEGMFLNLLPIIDSIYMASAAFGPEGFMQVQKQIEDFLKKEGIEEIGPSVGDKFNPETMEAIAEAESGDKGTAEGGDAGTIVEELQKGYKMGDKVFRPAKVKVSK